MRRTILLGACAVVTVLAAIVSVSSQASDPLIGTWKTNIAKSRYDPPSMQPKNPSILKREAVGDGYRVTSDGMNGEGKPTHIEYTFGADGKDYPLKGTASADSVNVVRIDANTQIQLRKKAGVVIAMYRQMVSKDGKTFTSDEIGYNAQGVAYHDTLVFDKQ
jgi:hypothetical protein